MNDHTALVPSSRFRSRWSAQPQQLREAYDLFRLEKQEALRSHYTLTFYDLHVGKFFCLSVRHPEIRDFRDLDVDVVRRFRAELAASPARFGGQLSPESLHCTHRALRAFLRWADLEGHAIDPRLLRLPAPRLPRKEATVFHASQVRALLSAASSPTEELMLRILIGSGVRMSELCGLAVRGPDGLSDLMIDSLDRGYAELRVRWESAKGGRARRVPITPQLAAAIKRYTSRHRPASDSPALLINRYGRPFLKGGVDATMTRLANQQGFRVHAHAFRHTFATVATQMGWNFERLRSAMGHADYSVLQRYVRLASDRDLGSLRDWEEFMVVAVMAVGAPAFFPSFAIPLWALVVGVRLLLVGRFPLAGRGSMAGPRQPRQQTIGQPRRWPTRHPGQQSDVTLSGRPARKISVALCQGPTTLLARRRCLRGARPRVGADAALVGVCRAWARGFTCAEREVAGGVVDRSLDHGRGQPYRFLVSELLFPHE